MTCVKEGLNYTRVSSSSYKSYQIIKYSYFLQCSVSVLLLQAAKLTVLQTAPSATWLLSNNPAPSSAKQFQTSQHPQRTGQSRSHCPSLARWLWRCLSRMHVLNLLLLLFSCSVTVLKLAMWTSWPQTLSSCPCLNWKWWDKRCATTAGCLISFLKYFLKFIKPKL